MSGLSKRFILVVLLAAVVAGAGAFAVMRLDIQDRADGPPLAGAMAKFTLSSNRPPAPPAPVFDAENKPHRLGDFKGRIVLVNFWATWCAPCVREMPSLARLQAALGGKDFTVLAISEDRGGFAVTGPFLERIGVEGLPILVDERLALASALSISAMPTTVLLDRDGREIGRLAGEADWDSAEARALIGHYLARQDVSR